MRAGRASTENMRHRTFARAFFLAGAVLLGLWPSAVGADLWDSPDLACLREAYPDDIRGAERDADGDIWLLTARGGRVLYGSEHEDVEHMSLNDCDVRASMAQPYPLDPDRPLPGPDERPGRMRSYPLLDALYGSGAEEVERSLEAVRLAGETALFSGRAGAAEALRRVAARLDELLARNPALRSYVLPLGGAFKWRVIAGEKRLSPHSYGMAVDLDPDEGPYWRWSGDADPPARLSYPTAIVRIFEDNGFIWGGKWREYDLMHFEYRPEIICKARMALQADEGKRPKLATVRTY